MVSNNHPAAVDLSPDQRIVTPGVTGAAKKRPFPHHKKHIWSKPLYMQQLKTKLAHPCSVPIIADIALQGGCIAIGYAAFTDLHQGIVFPVSMHERAEIAAVPCIYLAVQDGTDLLFISILGHGT